MKTLGAQLAKLKRAVVVIALMTVLPTTGSALSILGYQDGADYRFDYTGTLNTVSTLPFLFGSNNSLLDPSSGTFRATSASSGFYLESFGITGPGAFGTGGAVSGVHSGDLFGFSGGFLYVSNTFSSGDDITGSLVFAGQNVTSLGLTVGNYSITLPFDSISFDITGTSAAPVPLPAGWLLLGSALIGAGALRKKRAS